MRDEFEIALERERRILAEAMEGGEKDAETEACVHGVFSEV